MSKAVLISINPKWCEHIASGKKTVEVRKTKPKIETPFKCYIYATKDNSFAEKTLRGFDENGKAIYYKANKGKVIGEFVCDRIINIPYIMPYDIEDTSHPMRIDFIYETCVPDWELDEYLGRKDGFGWHISDLIIYDKQRSLGGFYHYCGDNPKCDGCELHYYSNTECGKEDYCCSPMYGCKHLKRPPKSWCYVEEVSDEQAD